MHLVSIFDRADVQIRIFVELSPVISLFRLVCPQFKSASVGHCIGNYSSHERTINRATVPVSEGRGIYRSLAHEPLQFIFKI